MQAKTIKAQPRVILNSRENRRQRRLGFVPSSINIKGKDSVSVLVNVTELKKALQQFGRSAVLTLQVDKDKYSVMVRDIEIQQLTGNFISVLFQYVSISEEIKVNIPIVLNGTDKLSLEHLNVSQQTDSLPVSGLAKDIPNSIDIDVSALKNGDNLFVKDVTPPKGIVIELDPEQLLLSVIRPRSSAESEDEEADTAADEQKAEESPTPEE